MQPIFVTHVSKVSDRLQVMSCKISDEFLLEEGKKLKLERWVFSLCYKTLFFLIQIIIFSCSYFNTFPAVDFTTEKNKHNQKYQLRLKKQTQKKCSTQL